MAYRLEANLSFGFHDSLVNTSQQVFKNSSLAVNVLTVAESLQDLTQRLQCIFTILWQYSNKHRTGTGALIRGRRLLTSFSLCGAYSSKYGIANSDPTRTRGIIVKR